MKARGTPSHPWLHMEVKPILRELKARKRILVFCLLCLWIVGSGWLLGGIIDDAFIFSRYADNMLHGRGLVFNEGERVEGITSLGHTLLVALFLSLGLDGGHAAVASSLLGAIAVIFIFLFYRKSELKLDMLQAAIVCATLPFLIWSASGMDECLLVFAVALLCKSAQRSLGQGRPPAARDWLIAGLAFAIRPEGLLLYLSLFVVSLKDLRRHPGVTIRGMAAGAVPIILLTVFRLLYFASPLPNTFYAKAGDTSVALLVRGAQYGGGAVNGLLPLFLLGAWGMARERAGRHAQWGIVLGMLLLLGLLRVGGDGFPLHRFALPLLPLLSCFAAPVLWKMRCGRCARLGIVIAFLLILLGWTIDPWGPLSRKSGLDEFRFAARQAATWERVGSELPKRFGGQHSLALTPIGAIGFRSRWRIMDLVGLIDRRIARQETMLGKGIPGHEKFAAEYVLARKPDFILLHTWLWPRIPPAQALGPALKMQAEQSIFRSPVFRRAYRPVALPLAGNFLILFARAAPSR
jgi:arabinofuranosyltransferase